MSFAGGFTTPTVNGSFDGWCGNCHPMTDTNGDGIWEVTFNLPAGNYEYKFAYDNWAGQENLTPGSSCTVTNFGYTNRALAVTGAATASTVCWGSCTACNVLPPSYSVTFQVDMQNVTGFTTPEVNGTFNGWCGNCNAMSDANADGIWEVTLTIPGGNYEYKFAYDAWTGQENLTAGSSCTVTAGAYTNRTLNLTANTTLPVVCWGSCTACTVNTTPGCTDMNAVNYNPAAGTNDGSCLFATNFNVDMNCTDPFTNVYITGPWCGWCGADTYNILTDANADGIYNVTLNLAAGNVEYKYMVDNWASQENLVDDMQNGASCAPITDYANYANRQIVTGTTTNDVSLSQTVRSTTNDTANFQMVQRAADAYLTALTTQRSLLGAYQNQIEYTVSNVTELSANLAAAKSNVVDTDYATETAALTKGQILQQAATAMLAQANQMPNVILSLLK
jgi:flagellin-like hook-associated protein FlgL